MYVPLLSINKAQALFLGFVGQSLAQPISTLPHTELPQHPQSQHYFLKGKLQRRRMKTSESTQATSVQAAKQLKNTGIKIRNWNTLNQVESSSPKSIKLPEAPRVSL